MSKINLQRGKLTVENRKSREKKRICSEVSVNSPGTFRRSLRCVIVSPKRWLRSSQTASVIIHIITSTRARDNHLLAGNFAKYSPIFNCFFFTGRLSNKPFLLWLLTTPPHFEYVAALPCNLSLIACFLMLMFHLNNHSTENLLQDLPAKEI